MTPCDLCHSDHWGTTCDGFPLMLLDDEPTERDCPLCTEPMNQTDRACTTCRAEAAALLPVVMPVLSELMWRRRLNAPERTVRAPEADEPVPPRSIRTLYDIIRAPGALTLLVVS